MIVAESFTQDHLLYETGAALLIAAAAAPLLAAAPRDRYALTIGDGFADQRSRRHPARVG